MIWLLRLRVAGRDWHLASRTCAPVQGTAEIPHAGLLSVGGFAEGLEIGGGASGPTSADLEFFLDEDGWTYALEGHRLEPAVGELSLWQEGWDYGQRAVLLKGRLLDVNIPNAGEPFTATLTERLIDQGAAWPDPSDVVTVDAWPNAPADPDAFSVVGTNYPMPIGLLGPYVGDGGSAEKTSTTPMIIVDDTGAAEVGCIAGEPVAATTVRIWCRELDTKADFSVSTTIDGTGRQRATVDLSGAPGPWAFDGSQTFYVTDWGQGGILGTRHARTAYGLGDAIVYLLERRYDADGPERIDYGSWAAMAGVLNASTVGIIPESGDPWDIIQSDLMPLRSGLYVMGGPNGVRPVLCLPSPGPTCRLLTVGRELDLSDEPPGYCDIEPLNAYTVNFAPSGAFSTYRAAATVDASTSPDAAAGRAIYGPRSDSLDAKATYDRGTALLAAAEMIRFRWCRPVYLVYETSAEVALSVQLGQRFRITDGSRHLTERLMWLMCRETEDGGLWALTFFGYW